MQIYLLRHGIAEDGRPGMPDSDRALTDEGKEKLRRVLKRAPAKPSLILSSPYRRALETAEIAAEVLGYEGKVARTRRLTPDASPADLWEDLRERKDEESVLLAGHQPMMSSLAAFLLDSPALQIDMKKAALARIDCERLGPRPGGVLKWLLTPAVCE
ncbi:MAG TPA: phosphohistidine phosphatase SixA [Bryobacteraceae bacterium]|jgi:phosphohistidine phosphatase|nr:phosphohistidine phosphatase SixA [Bryobacteraceae bacterium]